MISAFSAALTLLLVGCTNAQYSTPRVRVTDQQTRAAIPGPLLFREPPSPVTDVNPDDRRPVSILVPTTLQITRSGDRFLFAFGGFQSAQLTVGRGMVTGIREEVDFERNGAPTGSYSVGTYGEPLPPSVPDPNPVGPTDQVPAVCRVTIFETDQPPGYHVEAEEGNYYRVLWTRTFRGPFE